VENHWGWYTAISVKNVCMEDCMALSNMAESIDKFTYTDYCTWDDTVRYELVHGEAYMMAAPNTWHQRILRGLYDQLGEESIIYLKNIELNEPVTVLDGCILTLTGV
jgi:Uma2 family endonuclease